MNLSEIIIIFMIYSIVGWIVEEFDSMIMKNKLVNRGFLIGPYCPIYGVGALIIILGLGRYSYDPVVLFIMSMITCGVLEYLTSYMMEKLFKTRWWDYSNQPFNINGRICLGTLILFGVGGLVATYFAQPCIISFIHSWPDKLRIIFATALATLFILDNLVSYRIILNFKLVASTIRKDSTEEITAKVREILKSKSFLSSRLVKAFPNFKSLTKFKKRFKILNK